jgi:HlyD family secretion protein
MYVEAEMAYDDAVNIHTGQKAVITCDALPANNTGVVSEIGAMVGNNQLQNINPTAFTDPRVLLVKVRLDNPAAFANLVNGQVTVRLEP